MIKFTTINRNTIFILPITGELYKKGIKYMQKSHEVLRKAFSDIGVKKVASALGLSSAMVYKWCQSPPDDDGMTSGAYNPLDRLHRIYEVTGRLDGLEWLCQRAGGSFVQNDLTSVADDSKPMELIKDQMNQLAKSLEMFSKDDNQLDVTQLRQDWNRLKRLADDIMEESNDSCLNEDQHGTCAV